MIKDMPGCKKQESIFACQIGDNNLKALRYNNGTFDFCSRDIGNGAADKEIAEKIKNILEQLGYSNEQLIISVPRSHAACRYLRIPASDPDEIKDIISLQVKQFFPHSQGNMMWVYQIASKGSDGYSGINLAVVSEDLLRHYMQIFKDIKPRGLKVFLSSYGLCNLYGRIKQNAREDAPLVINIDGERVELAIISDGKLMYSRSLRFNPEENGRQNDLGSEIDKTITVYARHTSKNLPSSVVIFGPDTLAKKLSGWLADYLNLPIEGNGEYDSFSGLAGLAISGCDGSLDFLSGGRDYGWVDPRRHKENIKNIILAATVIIFVLIGMLKSVQNKNLYLNRLRTEISKIEKEAAALEMMKKRLDIVEAALHRKPDIAGTIYALHRLVPDSVKLSFLNWEDYNSLVFRGQAANINSALSFAKSLENSDIFKGFSIELKHMSKDNSQSSDIADFEIACNKKENVKRPR